MIVSTRVRPQAFTLIELLIVVAIIAILAAIAVPNFLEAQVRAKVSRSKNDLRTLATGLEAYAVDENHYPPAIVRGTANDNTGPSIYFTGATRAISCRLIPLTTPVSYLSSIPRDVFTLPDPPPTPENDGVCDTYDYLPDTTLGRAFSSGCVWRLSSAGPDRVNCFGGGALSQGAAYGPNVGGCSYDPTNGTTSAGDIMRVGPVSGNPGEPPFYNRGTNPAL